VEKKTWWLLDSADIEWLKDRNHSLEKIRELSFTDLVHLENHYLWGKVYLTQINPEDFVYFPRKWAHRVVTYDKAIGVSGYTV